MQAIKSIELTDDEIKKQLTAEKFRIDTDKDINDLNQILKKRRENK